MNIKGRRLGKQILFTSIAALMGFSVQAQVQVAVLDSGASADRGFNLVPGFNYFNNTSDTSEASEIDHGNESTGLIAQSFLGPIVPFVITDGTTDNEAQVTVARDNALSDILGRNEVKVVALTWGTSGVTGSSAPLVPQLSSNKLVAIMAGNEGGNQPNALASSSFNLPGVIIVGGTDNSGNLLSTTNRAGTTAAKYVTASGLRAGGGEGSGSSWATARIASIAGAVYLQNPNLTPQQVAEVILLSAEDRGAPGVDSEYGNGFIANAAQVLNNPIGQMIIADGGDDGGGGGSSSGGAALLVGGAIAGAVYIMRRPSSKLEKTLVLDSYGRGFHIDLNDHINVKDATLRLQSFFDGLQSTTFGQRLKTASGHTEMTFVAHGEYQNRLDLIEYFALDNDVAFADERADVSFSTLTQIGNGLSMDFAYQANPAQSGSIVSSLDNNALFGNASFISGQSFSSPLLGFSNRADSMGLAYGKNKAKGFSMRMGLVSVDEDREFGLQSLSTMIEGQYEFADNASLKLEFGQLDENRSLFGGSAGGVFGVDDAVTYAVNLSTKVALSERYQLVANYGIGHTKVDEANVGFLSNFTDLKSDWYALGLIGNNVFREHDQFGVAFSQPLKVRSGGFDFSVPTGRRFDGSIVTDSDRIRFSQLDATEHVLEAYYRTMLNRNLELGTFFSYRNNPYHVAENDSEALVMATLRYRH